MSRASTYPAVAIVLRTRLIGEKDRVMTLLSAEDGKFDAVAKGARTPTSKLAAASQPFVQARFLLARGRSLDITTQASVETLHPNISTDLWRTAWANYVCEICDALPTRQPDEAVYTMLSLALAALDDTQRDSANVELAGWWFLAQYISHGGYAPVIGRCIVSDEKIVVGRDDIEQRVPFSAGLGGTLSTAMQGRDPQRTHVLAQSLRAYRILERAHTPPTTHELETQVGSLAMHARRDLRDVLRSLLFCHLDLRPKSQKFLDEIRDAQHQI